MAKAEDVLERCTVVTRGVALYIATSLIVGLGMVFGTVALVPRTREAAGRDLIGRYINWDGDAYELIAREGYSYHPNTNSIVAYFPAFPLAGRWLAWMTGLRIDAALAIVANLCLLAAFMVIGDYVRRRYPSEPRELADYTLLALGLLPTTFFFRMAYSDAMCVLCIGMSLYGMQRRWHPFIVAALVGFTTAVRPVGVALLPALALYVWRRLEEPLRAVDRGESAAAPAEMGHKVSRCRVRGFSCRVVATCLLLALGAWGLAGFMTFQAIAFGDALAFAKTQRFWHMSGRAAPAMVDRAWGLATLEPIRAKYDPENLAYWARHDYASGPFSLNFADSIYFVFTIALIVVGCCKKRLNSYEWLTALFLLLIPYLTRSHENAMASFGRFSAVVLPAYLVMGHLLYRMGPALAAALLAISAFFLGVYSAMFAAGHRFL